MGWFHDLEMASLEGEPVAFDDFAGRACLVVNVASA